MTGLATRLSRLDMNLDSMEDFPDFDKFEEHDFEIDLDFDLFKLPDIE